MVNMRHAVVLAALTGLVLAIVLVSGAGLLASPSLAEMPTVIATVNVGTGNPSNGPEGVAIDTKHNRIFVANSKDNAVYVIDGTTNIVTTLTHSSLLAPWGAAYNPNNDKVYVASNARNSVVVINAATLVVEQELGHSSLNLPDQVVVDVLRNLVYVSNSTGGQITVINGATNIIAASFGTTLPAPHHMAIDASRNRIYVTNLYYITAQGLDIMKVFSNLSFTEIGQRGALAGPQGMAVRTVNGNIYVAQSYSDTTQWRVAVVSPLDMGFVVPFPGLIVNGRNLMGAAYSAGSDRVYVNGYSSNTVDVIDASNNTLLTTLYVGANPASGIAVNPNTGLVYVANRGSGTVSVIRDAPTGPTPTPTLGATPTVTPTPKCVGDSYEPDNSPETAKMINTAGMAQSHNICPDGDRDWMSFSVAGAMQLTLETRNLMGGADTMLYLYAPDGTTLMAYNDDAGVNIGGVEEIKANPNKAGLSDESKRSRLVYNFTKGGTYYIMVKDFDQSAFGSLRRYEVLISGGDVFDNRANLPVIIADF